MGCSGQRSYMDEQDCNVLLYLQPEETSVGRPRGHFRAFAFHCQTKTENDHQFQSHEQLAPDSEKHAGVCSGNNTGHYWERYQNLVPLNID